MIGDAEKVHADLPLFASLLGTCTYILAGPPRPPVMAVTREQVRTRRVVRGEGWARRLANNDLRCRREMDQE